MFKNLKCTKRLLMEATLQPVQGDRFQPTGFPDLGAATYQRPDGTRMILVESAQSMANRLEQTILGPGNELIPELKGLSYIRVNLTGATTAATNSLIEAHRINSPFIIPDVNFQNRFCSEAGYAKGVHLNWQKIARAFFRYDVNSLLHGAFLANVGDGRIKMPRSISGFIEAKDIREVVSGGVKFNFLDPTGKIRNKNFDKDVYGNVPYQRVEFTAGSITAYFNLDLGLLASYDLGPGCFELLIALALYKVRRFLESGTRLRTACDLAVKDSIRVTEPAGWEIPSTVALLETLKQAIPACREFFAAPPVTDLETSTVLKQKEEKGESESEESSEEETE